MLQLKRILSYNLFSKYKSLRLSLRTHTHTHTNTMYVYIHCMCIQIYSHIILHCEITQLSTSLKLCVGSSRYLHFFLPFLWSILAPSLKIPALLHLLTPNLVVGSIQRNTTVLFLSGTLLITTLYFTSSLFNFNFFSVFSKDFCLFQHTTQPEFILSHLSFAFSVLRFLIFFFFLNILVSWVVCFAENKQERLRTLFFCCFPLSITHFLPEISF